MILSKACANNFIVINQEDTNIVYLMLDVIFLDNLLNYKQIIKEFNMLASSKINEISNKIKDIVNSSPLGDVEKNLNALLKGIFTKMELVTREEFEVQAEVLRNTRHKLELLEARLAELEAQQAH
jgi:hypothetical protein